MLFLKLTIFKQKGKFLGTTILSRVINRDSRKLKFDESSDEEGEDSQADPQDIYAIRKERDFRSVPGMDGMFYKVRADSFQAFFGMC